MRRLALVLLVATPPLALADDDAANNVPPQPQLVAVHGKLDGQAALLEVRYELDVVGPYLSREELLLDLAPNSAVIGATVHVDGTSHVLALGEAAAIGTAFDALGSDALGAHPPWAFALSGSNPVELDIGAPHDAHVVIDLELSAPACYFRDARYVRIAKEWVDQLDRSLRTKTSPALEAACAGEVEGTEMGWIRLADRELVQRPYGEQRIGTTSGRLALANEDIARVEIDLASKLGHVPADLYTAILVDNSRSVSAQEQSEQRAIIASYLAKAPAGRVQIIAYDRRAHALLPAWSVASKQHTRINAGLEALVAANGSNLDVGLAEARRWLANVHGTRRLIAFSDEQLPWRIEVAALRAGLPAETLVHAIALHDGNGKLIRDDTSMLAPLASATEGVGFMTEYGGENPSVDATVLVRPIAFEHVHITAPGWTRMDLADCSDDTELAQGASCIWWGRANAAAGPIRITGQTWGHDVVRVLDPDPARGLSVARQLLASASTLEDALRLEVERAARAVNSVWSLAAIWGGDGGYADHESGGIGWGTIGCGCGVGTGGSYDRGSMIGRPPKTLKAQLETAIASCKVGGAKVVLDLELTADEIVDVEVQAPAAVSSCVTEAVWNAAIVLGSTSHRREHVELP